MRTRHVAILLTIAGVTAASADTLLPGGLQYKDDPAVNLQPIYSDTAPDFVVDGNLVATLSSPMELDFEGTVTTNVFQDPDSNGLCFQYQIELTDMNSAAIVRTTMGGWVGINILDVGSDASGSSGTLDAKPEWSDGDPLFMERDIETEGLIFQFRSALNGLSVGTVIGPGDTSAVMFVSTDAPAFTENTMALIDTAQVGRAAVLVPVPEPSSVVLLVGGLVAAALRRRGLR